MKTQPTPSAATPSKLRSVRAETIFRSESPTSPTGTPVETKSGREGELEPGEIGNLPT